MRNFLLLVLLTLQTLSAQAQRECGPPKYMRQSLANVIVKGILLNGLSEMGYNKDVSIMGTYMPEGEQVGFTTTLNAGTLYAFVGGGDDDVTDLDIYLYNERGTEVARDAKADNSPIVTYTPTTTGRYTVRVKMYSTRTAGSFASMLIMSNRGYNIPVNTLKSAISDLFSAVETICNNSTKMGYLSTTNQWAMFGCVLEDGGSTTVSSIKLSGTRRSVIVGGGDQNAFDVDLFLYDAQGNLLKKDEATDAHPLLIYSASATPEYQLKMKNARSGGNRSLIMSAILEVD
ncbi:MAG: PPC domain-containing protein [Saprospiraceae bacterium]|nr:PPC domain-containing protein [Saprospiraceae bacterium]